MKDKPKIIATKSGSLKLDLDDEQTQTILKNRIEEIAKWQREQIQSKNDENQS